MGQTIVEKIAQAHLAEGPKRPLRTGDFVSIHPRYVMTHDNTSAVMRCLRSTTIFRIRMSRIRRSTARLRRSPRSTGWIFIPPVPALATRSWWNAGTWCRARLWSPPIRTPTCTALSVQLAPRSCAPMLPPSGQPAISGGRFRDLSRSCSKANCRKEQLGKMSSSPSAVCITTMRF